MKLNNNIPDMILEAKKAKFLPHGVLQVIIALAIIIFTQLFSGLIVGFFLVFKAIISGVEIDSNSIMEQSTLPSLYATLITTIVVILYVLFIEKRNIYSLGFGKKHALFDYILGLLVGVIMFSTIIFILYITNNLQFESASLSVLPIVIVFFLGFIFQGASEEICMRGYLLNSIAARHNIVIAVVINSSIFGVLHLTNPNVTVFSIINIILFGVFASIYALKFNNIWGVCALHSAWNFVQGNIYGLEVSGIPKVESLWHFKEVGNDLLTGGKFGPEGGLVTTIVLLISTIIVALLRLNRNKKIV